MEINDIAPDFELESTDGNVVRLSDMVRNGPVLLNFYVGDFGINCTNYMNAFGERLEELTGLGVTIIGINNNSMENHKGFKKAIGLRWELLFDKDMTVAKAYGAIVGPGHMTTGFTNREFFLIDGNMRILYVWKAPVPKQIPVFDELLDGIRAALQ